MKKIILALALLIAAAPCFAQSGYTQNAPPFYSCSAVATTGACVYATMPFFGVATLPSDFTWVTDTAGSPAALSITLEGSIDGRSTLDGVATSGSATITSATMKFTQIDVGKAVYMGGAGSAGATYVGTLASVTNATTAALNATASSSVVGAPLFIGNFSVLDTSTNTSGETRSVVNYPMRFLRCNVGTLAGGTSPTVNCAFVAKGA